MSDHSQQPRREFLQTTLLTGVAGLAAAQFPGLVDAAEKPAFSPLIKPGSTILFQGDSITDAGRSRPDADTPNQKPGMGNGYAWMTAAALLTSPGGETLTIYNRGISGNKVFQLAERWQAECLDLKPDVLSILIGVNDIWHRLNGKYDGTVETYEKDYRELLRRTKAELPDVRLVICEPFVLRCGAVNDSWFPLFDQFREAAHKLAGEFKTVFVPFQSMFDDAVKYAPPEHWAGDGVHPTAHGAALMASHWIRCVHSAT